MAGRHLWSTPVLPEWIDFNGHMRDAYYRLVVSLTTDVLMDELGMDAACGDPVRVCRNSPK